jgi:hypothetical protein
MALRWRFPGALMVLRWRGDVREKGAETGSRRGIRPFDRLRIN